MYYNRWSFYLVIFLPIENLEYKNQLKVNRKSGDTETQGLLVLMKLYHSVNLSLEVNSKSVVIKVRKFKRVNCHLPSSVPIYDYVIL